MTLEITSNGDGSYSVRDATYDYDYSDTPGKSPMGITQILGYLLTLIGLGSATYNIAVAAPTFLFIPILLDVLALSPLFLSPIAAKLAQKSLPKGKKKKTLAYPDSGLGQSDYLSLLLAILRFFLRYAYVVFLMTLAAYWVLFFLEVGGELAGGLMAFSMYGMYYFPYLLASRAKEYESRALSIVMIAGIILAIASTVLASEFLGSLGDRYALMYPVILPTILALVSVVAIPIVHARYLRYGYGAGALSWKTIGIIFGVLIGVLVLVLVAIWVAMNG